MTSQASVDLRAHLTGISNCFVIKDIHLRQTLFGWSCKLFTCAKDQRAITWMYKIIFGFHDGLDDFKARRFRPSEYKF